MVELSIIILNYKTSDLTIACLKSIISKFNKELEFGRFEIIVADNGSKDASVESIKYYVSSIKYKNIKILENKENLGFAKGMNKASQNAKGKYLLFLNSDTEMLDKGLTDMIEFLDSNKKVAILGGKFMNKDGSLQPSCGKFYTLFNLFLMLIGTERLGFLRESPSIVKKVDWVSGGFMMVKRDIFKKLGCFDENFFMYMEDMDICYRAKKEGWDTYFFPRACVVHNGHGSSSRTFAIINIYKGILYFYKKHNSYWQYILARTLLTAKAITAIFFGFLTNNIYLKNTYKSVIRIEL
ncbi:MAG: glycosyltransferase family 2 protein [Candidatus Levybacteria bacterium]|nr:glycosyltransferase family 2 protein [Candidatus Levybacteria bacterium]